MPDSSLTRLTKKNLLLAIKAAVGSNLFKHLYVRRDDGSEFDALEGGKLSCVSFLACWLNTA